VLAILVFLAMTGCSKSSTPSQIPQGTPPGSYTVTVTATCQGLSNQLKLSLTVQ